MIDLSFTDQSRMKYSEQVAPREAGEFVIRAEGDVGAEFTVVLHDFSNVDGLSPQMRVFGDAVVDLQAFIAVGGLTAIGREVKDPATFSLRLLDLGLRDASDISLAGGRS